MNQPDAIATLFNYAEQIMDRLMMIGGFYGLDYPYGSRTIAPYGDSVSKCLLVVGGSGVQPSGYPAEELSQSMSY